MRESDRKRPKGKDVNPITGETGPPTALASEPPMVQMMKNLRKNAWWDASWRKKRVANAQQKYDDGWERTFGKKDEGEI